MSNNHVTAGQWTEQLPVIRSLTFPFIVSLVLACLLVISSVAGLLFGQSGLHQQNPETLPTFLAQDAITLLVAVPLLLAAVWNARTGSLRGLLLWMGTLFYIAYAYSFAVLGTWLPPLFLVYAWIVSMSLYSFVYLLVSVNADAVRARFSAAAPVRWAGGFVMVMALLLGTMETASIIADVLSGTAPKPTLMVVWPLDLVIAFPALFWGGLWLWRKQPLGYVVGAVVLLKAAAEGLALVVQTVATMLMSGIGDDLLPAYAVIGFGGLLVLLLYLRTITAPEQAAVNVPNNAVLPSHA
jgi:hypothetical protein